MMPVASPGRHPGRATLVIGGPIAPDDVGGLCDRVRAKLDVGDTHEVLCDVGALIEPDVVVIEALARMQLAARHLGGSIRLRHVGDELHELLALIGLSDVVPVCCGLLRGAGRQTKEREQARRVEEEVEPGDTVG